MQGSVQKSHPKECATALAASSVAAFLLVPTPWPLSIPLTVGLISKSVKTDRKVHTHALYRPSRRVRWTSAIRGELYVQSFLRYILVEPGQESHGRRSSSSGSGSSGSSVRPTVR